MTQLPKSDTSRQLDGLLAEARAGSNEALDRILEVCRSFVLRVVEQEIDSEPRSRITPEDWVQEVFLEARRGFGDFRGNSEAELKDWLRHIFLRDVLDLTRSDAQAGRPSTRNGHGPADSSRGQSADAPQEEERRLYQALARLPAHHRQVILWRNRDRLAFEHIAARLVCTVQETRKIWLRALELLAQEIEAPP